jgi:hypothetical protein
MKSLAVIENEVTRLAAGLGASGNDFPSYGRTRDSAYPHIEVDKSSYHYVTVERGVELARKSSGDFDELLYWIFADTTHRLAFACRSLPRVADQDRRRAAFARQLELLETISPAMAARRADEIQEILQLAP